MLSVLDVTSEVSKSGSSALILRELKTAPHSIVKGEGETWSRPGTK